MFIRQWCTCLLSRYYITLTRWCTNHYHNHIIAEHIITCMLCYVGKCHKRQLTKPEFCHSMHVLVRPLFCISNSRVIRCLFSVVSTSTSAIDGLDSMTTYYALNMSQNSTNSTQSLAKQWQCSMATKVTVGLKVGSLLHQLLSNLRAWGLAWAPGLQLVSIVALQYTVLSKFTNRCKQSGRSFSIV